MLVFEDVSSNLLPFASMEDSIPRLANLDKPLNPFFYKLPWLWWVLTATVKQQLTPTSEHDVLGTHLKQMMSPNLTSQHKQQLPHWHVIVFCQSTASQLASYNSVSTSSPPTWCHAYSSREFTCLTICVAGCPHLCFVFLNWRPPGLPVPKCLRRMLSDPDSNLSAQDFIPDVWNPFH